MTDDKSYIKKKTPAGVPVELLATRPGKNPLHSIAGFTVRQVEVDDLNEIDRLMAQEGFNTGLQNMQLFYEANKACWFVIVEDSSNRIVAFDSYTPLPNNIYMGYNLIVDRQWRGKGLVKLFASFSYGNYSAFGNTTAASMDRFAIHICMQKLKGYFGNPPTYEPDLPIDSTVEIIRVRSDDEYIKYIDSYDHGLCNIDRSAFNRRWCLDEKYAICYAAVTDRRTLGFVVLRQYCEDAETFYAIQPLYADSNAIAQNLFSIALSHKPSQAPVYFLTHAKNDVMLKIAYQLQLTSNTNENRWYSPKAYMAINHLCNWPKAYCIHEIYHI